MTSTSTSTSRPAPARPDPGAVPAPALRARAPRWAVALLVHEATRLGLADELDTVVEDRHGPQPLPAVALLAAMALAGSPSGTFRLHLELMCLPEHWQQHLRFVDHDDRPVAYAGTVTAVRCLADVLLGRPDLLRRAESVLAGGHDIPPAAVLDQRAREAA